MVPLASADCRATRDYPGHGFAWERNGLGADDSVAPGFAPIRDDGHTIHVAGHRYRLRDGLLPAALVTAGTDVLAAPMRLHTKPAARGPLSTRTLLSTPTCVAVLNTLSAPDHRLSTITWVGIDGFMRIDVRLEPVGPFSLDALAIEIDLPADLGVHFERSLEYDYLAQRFERADLANSQGPLPGSLAFGFSPTVWVGKGAVGLEVVSQTDAHHSLRRGTDAFRIERGTAGTRIVQTIVDRRVRVIDRYAFSFGLAVTPVHRTGGLARTHLLTAATRASGAAGAFDEVYIGHWRRDALAVPGLPNAPRPGDPARERHVALRSSVARAGSAYVPYAALHLMASTLPEIEAYRDDWAAAPARAGSPIWARRLNTSRPVQPVSMGERSLHDFVLDRHVAALRNDGIDGMYFDVASPVTVAGPPSDARTRRTGVGAARGGARSSPVFAHREFLLRYWKATKGIDPDFLIIHHGSHLPRYVRAFIDAAVFGEAAHDLFETRPMRPRRRPGSPVPTYPRPDRYVPDYLALPESAMPGNRSANDTVSHVLLPQVRKFNEDYLDAHPASYDRWSRSAAAVWLLHDLRLWNTRLSARVTEPLLRALAGFEGLATATHRRLAGLPPDISGARYDVEGRALIVLANRGDTPERVELSPFDVPGTVRSARLPETGGELPVTGDRVAVDVPAGDFVLVSANGGDRSGTTATPPPDRP